MIYSYADLRGKIKVGTVVRAVPGKPNECANLSDDGSNTQEITSISEDGFCIGGCGHSLTDTQYFLDIVSDGLVKSLDNFEVGDQLKDGAGDVANILAVIGDLIAFRWTPSIRTASGIHWVMRDHFVTRNFTVVVEETKPREVTMADVVAKFGEDVVIKKEN